jgi:sugar/nucleoside kinase (ribokinase family)
VLCSVGDLVEDVVVRPVGPIQTNADTPSRIERRRGGSAATVAAIAAGLGVRARFVGAVGADATGDHLVAELTAQGVDVVVRRTGRTGAIVVLVGPDGERTMLTDRGAATQLADPDPAWLDGVLVLHVPAYSLDGEPLATTTKALVASAHQRGIAVTVDASSTTTLAAIGVDVLLATTPAVLFANAAEADAAGWRDRREGVGCLVVKHGAAPTAVIDDRGCRIVPVPPVAGITDTTGAGDAFAAGFLGAWMAGTPADDAVLDGHRAAADLMRARA